jgi:hypothetical protein
MKVFVISGTVETDHHEVLRGPYAGTVSVFGFDSPRLSFHTWNYHSLIWYVRTVRERRIHMCRTCFANMMLQVAKDITVWM